MARNTTAESTDKRRRQEVIQMERDLKVGDEVQLKSGGPIMTVGRIWAERGQTMAHCDWLEGNKRQSGSVSVTSLKLADERASNRMMQSDR